MIGPHPSDKELILTLLGAIATHPHIRNPVVTHPVKKDRNGNPAKVPVDKFRTFGGTELKEPGLTIAVYPFHSSYKNLESSPTQEETTKFATSTRRTLGKPSDLDFFDRTDFRLICQVYYIDSGYDVASNATYYLSEILPGRPHGDYFEGMNIDSGTFDKIKIAFTISPGEDVLRDYVTLLRSVIRETYQLKPYSIRNIRVDSVDYPSANAISVDSNMFLHTAYITFTLTIYETPTSQQLLQLTPYPLGISRLSVASDPGGTQQQNLSDTSFVQANIRFVGRTRLRLTTN